LAPATTGCILIGIWLEDRDRVGYSRSRPN
jgi:hypothetical protein